MGKLAGFQIVPSFGEFFICPLLKFIYEIFHGLIII
jgi:hypothetical protein